MKIDIHNSEAFLAQADEVERMWLAGFLSFSTAGFMGRPGGRTCLLSEDNKFPAGFIPNIFRAFNKDVEPIDLVKPGPLAGRTLTLNDCRNQPPFLDPDADVEWLRHHPAALARGHDPIVHLIDAYQTAVKRLRGVIWIPMGGGKGELVAAFTRAWPTASVLVLVPENVSQLAKRIRDRTGQDVGECGEGKYETDERITVAGFQTLARRLKAGDARVKRLLERIEVMIVDEVHMLPANGMWSVAMAAVNARVRLGLSATPSDRMDDKNLYVTGATGPIIYRVRPQVLIELGIISEPNIRMVPCVQTSLLGNFDDVYEALVVKSEQRNRTIANIALVAKRPGFVFVEREKHGFILKKHLEQVGLNTEFVWGAIPQRKRKQLVQQMLDGNLHHIVCSGVFRQGLDVPSLSAVINAAGRKSTTWTLQRLGRGSRADAVTEKYDFEYWDILDHGQRYLEGHTENRVAAFRQEGYIPKIVTGLEAPNEQGIVPDFQNMKSGVEIHREEQKAYRDAVESLTGQRTIRRRSRFGINGPAA